MYIIIILHMIYLWRRGVLFIVQQFFKKYGKTMLFPGIGCVILLYLFLQQNDSSEETLTMTTIPQDQTEQLNTETEQMEEPIVEKIMVDVKGAVKYPGVYELTTDDRVIDAIEDAGGYVEEAETTAVNHAQKLQDEMVIYIPKIGEPIENFSTNGQVVTTSSENDNDSSDKVNLNSADETALTTLPGIGPSKAQAIIAYREENGSFKTIDDLKSVSGIGDKTFEKLRELIDVK